MDSITQKEFDRRFAEYVKDKKVTGDNILEYKLQLVKQLKEEGLTIRAGFSVDQTGKVTYE
jgi:hypothetical protein